MDGQNPFDFIAIFNTYLGLSNMEKNTKSQAHLDEIDKKLNTVLDKLDSIERRIIDGGDNNNRI